MESSQFTKVSPSERALSVSLSPGARRKEGLNWAYTLGGLLWMMLGSLTPSITPNRVRFCYTSSMREYEGKMRALLGKPDCLARAGLIERGYMKEKHVVYSAFIGTMSTLPVLFRCASSAEMLRPILGKMALGTGTKLLDNLNDIVQTREEALISLRGLYLAMTKGNYEPLQLAETRDPALRAANSALELGKWVYESVLPREQEKRKVHLIYLNDVRRLIEGQFKSLVNDDSATELTLNDYLNSIAEKSIGCIWADIDLSALEERLLYLDNLLLETVKLLRAAEDLLFKSLLIYDDVEDIEFDLAKQPPNAAILLALDRGVLSAQNLQQRPIPELVSLMHRTGVLQDTVKLADLVFLKAVQRLLEAKALGETIFDWRALALDFRFVRLFLLRKILMHWRNPASLAVLMSSAARFDNLRSNIPEDVAELEALSFLDVKETIGQMLLDDWFERCLIEYDVLK